MHAVGGSYAFTWQRHRLHNVATLPSISGATASAMLHAFGMLQHCIPTLQHCLQLVAAALLLDSDTAFPMRQHGLQMVAGSTAFTRQR